ncbi:MAG: transferrin receptor-like dimerization domain-containing protein [Bacteroidota bacterium]
MGFTSEGSAQQLEMESKFDEMLRAGDLDEWMKYMSARPHHVGSPYDKEVVNFIAGKFKDWGYDVKVESFNILFPTPKVRLLEMVSPTTYKAALEEPPVEGDLSSNLTDEALPPYNCFSIDGDVTAELVFVNYGLPADYDELEKLGIDVKGKIVLAKYMGSWRGIKPKVAAEKGAIGCIIYSDPEDDGFFQGETYPEGPFKSEFGVQRGAVMDLPLAPGDVLTPGYGATNKAKRLPREEAPALTKIPVLPISYHDAKPLLEALEGPVAPGSWRGALPLTYHVGPGPAKVHLKVEFNWDMKPAYDVIATLKGSEYPDEWVIRGNHHDAWVHGANDPISGMITLMEEARAVSELAKMGMKPKRTILFCAWGAEEPGLIGSTEWVETNEKELKEKAVAYINTDGTASGFLYAGGSHTLEKFFSEITEVVYDPEKNVSVLERRKALESLNGDDWSGFKLYALGSGSDYSPFFQHSGIASFNLGFGGESSGGEYHTMYDTYEMYKRFKDPSFQYGVALTKVAGRTTLRLANAEILPFEFQNFAQTVSGYVDEVIKLADNMREQTEKENKLILSGAYELAVDPKETFIVPQPKASVPYFNFSPLQNALENLKTQSKAFDEASSSNLIGSQKLIAFNQQMKDMERLLTNDKGLPGRPWFKHHIYAPGFYTGYGVKTLPGVREAIEQREFDEVDNQIVILAELLNQYGDKIEEAVGLMK